jgi:HPt (histidine-containing phosphotransfer) domain-containing protein
MDLDHLNCSVPMDYQSALERVGMDQAFLRELIAMYKTEFSNFCRRIREAMESSDFPTVRMLAHSLKGSSASLSFPGLRRISEQLESAGDSRDPQCIEKNLAVLLKEYQRLNEFLADFEVV